MILPKPVRRLLVPVLLALELGLLGLMVALMAVGAVLALFDRRARVFRLAAMGATYIVVEQITVAGMLGTWLLRWGRTAEWSRRRELALLARAIGAVLAAARRWLGVRVELEEPPVLSPFDTDEPVLVLARHGGFGDSFVVIWLLAAWYQRRPRVVVKGLLLWEPLFDVALSRMGACWVPGGAASRTRRSVGAAAAALGPGEALVVFPEGQNWTPKRRLRTMARLWRSGRPDALKAAALMENVLVPRPGGVMAGLDARPDLPVVVVAHAGLEVTSARELWRALPFREAMRLRWWLAAPPPGQEDERLEWLTLEWAVVDQWISAYR